MRLVAAVDEPASLSQCSEFFAALTSAARLPCIAFDVVWTLLEKEAELLGDPASTRSSLQERCIDALAVSFAQLDVDAEAPLRSQSATFLMKHIDQSQ
jgi:hypothetical protein